MGYLTRHFESSVAIYLLGYIFQKIGITYSIFVGNIFYSLMEIPTELNR